MLYLTGVSAAVWPAAIAVVGSRNPTPQGLANARQFARSFAQAGFSVVSGLALGVDGAAHEGALEGAATGPACHRGRGGHRARPRLSTPAPRTVAPDRAGRASRQRIPDRHAAAAANFPKAQPHHRGAEPGHGGGRGRAPIRIAHHGAPGGRTGQGGVRDSRVDPFTSIARLPRIAQAGGQAGRDGPGRAGGHAVAGRFAAPTRAGIGPASAKRAGWHRRKTSCCRPWASIR